MKLQPMYLFTVVEKKFCAEPLSPLYSREVTARYSNNWARKTAINISTRGKREKASLGPVTGRFANVPFVNVLHYPEQPNENIVQNHLNIALLNAF